MRQLGFLAFAVVLGLALVDSCGSDTSKCCGVLATGGSASGGSATGGGGGRGFGGAGGTGCQHQEYAAPGCGTDVRPICTNGSGGTCFQRVCGCDGHVLTGCGLFPVKYAHVLPTNVSSDAGDMCDPTADAGL